MLIVDFFLSVKLSRLFVVFFNQKQIVAIPPDVDKRLINEVNETVLQSIPFSIGFIGHYFHYRILDTPNQ
jgi:hypothetical protein